jgi:hypothetical protein
MLVGGLFGVCAWFGWLFELWRGHDLQPLGMSLLPEAPSGFLLKWYFMGVLLNSQMVNANVSVRLPKANKLQREGKMKVGDKTQVTLRVMQEVALTFSSVNGVPVQVYL